MRTSACSLLMLALAVSCTSAGKESSATATSTGTCSSSFIQVKTGSFAVNAFEEMEALEEDDASDIEDNDTGEDEVEEQEEDGVALKEHVQQGRGSEKDCGMFCGKRKADKGDGKDKCRENGKFDDDCCAKRGQASCADGFVLTWTGAHCWSHSRWGNFSYYTCDPPTKDNVGKSKCREKGKFDDDCCAKREEASCADGFVLTWTGTHCWSHTRWGNFSDYRCDPPTPSATTRALSTTADATPPTPSTTNIKPSTTTDATRPPTPSTTRKPSTTTRNAPPPPPKPSTTTRTPSTITSGAPPSPTPSPSKSYQPAIPPAGATPAEFWTGGPFIDKQLEKSCPPWTAPPFTQTAMIPGHDGCKRDAINLAVRFIRPSNRCGPGGRCAEGREWGSCVNYNKLKWYPEYNQAGFCITTGPTITGANQLAYVEKTLANNYKVGKFYVNAIKWAQTDSPARYSCDSFCKKCDRSSEYCPNTAESPIASGEPGSCDCHCRSGVAAADFDRCTTVSAAVCTEHVYCGANGKAIFTPTGTDDEGSCKCECHDGYYGRNCELREGESCDINDCNHRTNPGDLGIRPNCACTCGGGIFNFMGPTCEDWKFGSRGGTWSSTSSNFTIQRQSQGRCFGGCKPPGQLGEECVCSRHKGKGCRGMYSGRNGCVGDTSVVHGPEAFLKNSKGLACLMEQGGGKYRCQKAPTAAPTP